jgi:transcriptional regulator with XRE-family HTH domain
MSAADWRYRKSTDVNLKAWRETRGLTQAELAALLGIQVFTISKWERGATKRQAPGRLLELALAEVDRQLSQQSKSR